MTTECIQKSFAFHSLARREIVARFDGGRITSVQTTEVMAESAASAATKLRAERHWMIAEIATAWRRRGLLYAYFQRG